MERHARVADRAAVGLPAAPPAIGREAEGDHPLPAHEVILIAERDVASPRVSRSRRSATSVQGALATTPAALPRPASRLDLDRRAAVGHVGGGDHTRPRRASRPTRSPRPAGSRRTR